MDLGPYYPDMARSEWGGGSIYRVKNGRYRVAVSLGHDAFGKRIRKEWQVRSEAEATRRLKEVNARLRGGLSAADSRVTLAVYAQDWLAGVKPNVKPSTHSFYATLAEAHLAEMGHLPIVSISTGDVRQLIARRLAQGYATRTVRGIVDVLRMILKQAEQDGIVSRNVAALVPSPKLEQADPVHFTAEQARRFLEVSRGDSLFSLYACALGTGLRRGELLSLTWRDAYLGDERGVGATLTVRRSKTTAGVRTVPLANFGAEALRALPREPGPIWKVRPEYVTRRMAYLCEKAGLPRLTFHQLRHTTASLLLDSGVDLAVVQQILGHTRVGMSMHYARAGEALKRDAMDKLGRAVG